MWKKWNLLYNYLRRHGSTTIRHFSKLQSQVKSVKLFFKLKQFYQYITLFHLHWNKYLHCICIYWTCETHADSFLICFTTEKFNYNIIESFILSPPLKLTTVWMAGNLWNSFKCTTHIRFSKQTKRFQCCYELYFLFSCHFTFNVHIPWTDTTCGGHETVVRKDLSS